MLGDVRRKNNLKISTENPESLAAVHTHTQGVLEPREEK